MFTHIQKVDRGLQASSVAAKILKQKWLAGLVPLEKTLASPPVTRGYPLGEEKLGEKLDVKTRKKARSFRASVRWGFVIKLKKDLRTELFGRYLRYELLAVQLFALQC
jgi:hypothetical protein